MVDKPKIVAVLPAYNAAKTLVPFLKGLPRGLFYKIILVDDCSKDGTYNLAKKQKGIYVYKTERNLGYGGNLKYCLDLALKNGADIVIEIHPDGEYKTDGIKPAIEEIRRGASLVLGNRFGKGAVQRGMFWWKIPFIRSLSFVDNIFLGTNISDMHQGFRVYTKKLLSAIPYQKNSNDYIFSFEIITQSISRGFKISSVPVSTYYRGKKRGATTKAVTIYSLQTFYILFKFLLENRVLR